MNQEDGGASSARDNTGESYWSGQTRDWTFFVALFAATVALPILFLSYLNALLFAVVVVVVTWPLYERVCRVTGQRRALSAGLTAILLALVIFVPITILGWYFVAQAIGFATEAVAFIQDDGVAEIATSWTERWRPTVEGYVGDYLPPDFDPVAAVADPIQRGALTLLQTASGAAPNLVASTAKTLIDVVIFVFAVITLYMEGPAVITVVKRLSPMDDRYEDDLFGVFRLFSTNMVIGALASAVLQGFIAGIGYLIAGAPSAVLWAVFTGVGSFVPVVGTVVVWLPVSIYVAATQGIGWGIFLALWSLLLTGTVDNVVKPLIMRGGTQIHPLLIFLGVFGGLSWMGVPGVLVGPVIVAFFLALYTIYVRDFLEIPQEAEPVAPPAPSTLGRLRGWIGSSAPARAPAPGPAPGPAPATPPPVDDAPTDPGAPGAA